MEHAPTLARGIAMGCIVAGTVVLAALLRFGLGRLKRRAGATPGQVDDVVVRLLRGLVPASTVLIGLWLASLQLALAPNVRLAVDRVLVAVAVLVVTLVAAQVAAGGVRVFAAQRTGVAPATSIFANIIRAAVVAVGLLVMLETFGVSITPLLTALGVGGLAVALALQDTLSNLFAGIHILASKKIEPGDYVKLTSGDEGYVEDVNWRNTAIRALANNLVLVPNARLSSEIVVNYQRPARELSVLVQVGVSYDSDLDVVEQVTIEVASEVMSDVEGGVPAHEPFIRYHTFGASSIDFSVILRAREYADQYVVVHEFVKRLHRRYRSEGISIPFPIRTILTEDPKPPERLPNGTTGTAPDGTVPTGGAERPSAIERV